MAHSRVPVSPGADAVATTVFSRRPATGAECTPRLFREHLNQGGVREAARRAGDRPGQGTENDLHVSVVLTPPVVSIA